MQSARLAVDIGGTFTDLALEHAGGRTTAKVLTTPSAPEQGVLNGVRAVLETAGLAPSDIAILIHGTTLATNAVIERKGATTALITTEGFRDVLAMGNESRYDQYDLNIVLPEPLVPRHLRLPVPERLDNEGKILLPVDEAAVRALVPVLKREGVQSIAVGLLHAFVNGVHEQRVRAILAEALPDIPVSLSSEVSPEMREWERFSTTVANAYVQPLMASYLRRLESELRAMGLMAPVFLMLSGGGLTTIETACRFPIRLVESGPAGGAIISAHIAKLPLRIPVIDMVEIGAGGGSLAAVDTMGRITVGPQSAGADPGPACYGRGGKRPAVTDANLLLGRYDAARFAGGTMRLDENAAATALGTAVGERLGLDAGMAALGVIEMVDENMANAARVHAIESGKTYEGRTLIAFGGGGPVHACRVAEKIGIRRVLVPAGAGVGSAIGFLRAPVGYEVVRSLYQRFSRFDVDAVNALLLDMRAEAETVVAAGSFGAPSRETRIAYMRYVGQGHEIPVPMPSHRLLNADVADLRAAYDTEYSRFYDRPVPGSDVEIMSFAVIVATVPEARPDTEMPDDPAMPDLPARTQAVRDTATGLVAQWEIHERIAMGQGRRLLGPAIITEDETSTLVSPGWTATLNAQNCIELTHEAAQ
jgi:N-methylhydantoinase A